MSDQHADLDAAGIYAAAYTAHYSDRNPALAVDRYVELIESHPETQEARYSLMQLQNIIHAEVPKQDVLAAQLKALRAHLTTQNS